MVVAIIGGLYLRAVRRAEATKLEAEGRQADALADVTVTQAAKEVVTFYRDQFTDLRNRVADAEERAEAAEEDARKANRRLDRSQREMRDVKAHVEHLEAIMQTQGLNPPERPRSWSQEDT